MKKKNIVVLIDWYLPGNKAGGPVKSVYSMLSLLKNEYNFSVITTNHDLGSTVPYKGIKPNSWNSYDGIPVYYFSKEGLKSKNLIELINSLHPDIVYLNSFWSYYFSLLPLRAEKSGKLKCDLVLAPRGMLGKGALSIKPLKKKLFLSLLKFVNLHSKVVFHATMMDEEKEIKGFFRKANVRVAANINSTPILKNKSITKHRGTVRFFYLSRVAKVKNLHYALQMLLDMPSDADITYDIYGSMEDKVYWKECEQIIKQLPASVKVTYKGELSFEEVQPVISNYHFLLLPTLNENFGHSIAETLRSACPVIISDHTPWNGINKAKCGYALDLKNKTKFKEALLDAIQADEKEYASMSQNCINFMEQHTNFEKDKDAYKKLFS
ncbi:MAG: glycosyltransferase [Bacteroidetes bacterium]|nr:glycosyltransferase [Bacteroidota bacterium]